MAIEGYPKSAEHETYRELMPAFFERVQAQEDMYVKAGFPAQGASEWIRSWFRAWQVRDDLQSLRDAMTPDCEYVDSSSFGELRSGRDLTIDSCRHLYKAFPDTAFYPQGNGPEALPYWDFLDGQVRATVPWRWIGRFSYPLDLPDLPYVPATGKSVNVIGVDRYLLTPDWKIARIDTDWDMFGALFQFVGLPHPRPNGPTYRVVGTVGKTLDTVRHLGRHRAA